MQQVAAQIPWFHNCVILEKVKDPALREWYARACIEHGWSRAVLEPQTETRLHERTGRAITNLGRTLPAAQSELPQQILKDPCSCDLHGPLSISNKVLQDLAGIVGKLANIVTIKAVFVLDLTPIQ